MGLGEAVDACSVTSLSLGKWLVVDVEGKKRRSSPPKDLWEVIFLA
jgi:hypothetical protein